MANNRIYYPIQQVTFRKPGSTVYQVARGVQSVAISTTFNLTQAFELGQLAIYENIEGIPAIEVTLNKVLDGYPPLYLLATASDKTGANLAGPTLAKRAVAETICQLGIWPETDEYVSGRPRTYVEMSGLTVSSVSYTFPLDDNFTEDLTLAGNVKVWNTGTKDVCLTNPWVLASGSGFFTSTPDAPIGSGGVQRRENLIFATNLAGTANADKSILPTDILGVGTSGFKTDLAHISSITVSTDLAREDLFELGTRRPYARTVTFPVEVTCEIEVTSVSGDLVDAIDKCGGALAFCSSTPNNLSDQKIRIATCEGLRLYLGTKNKLSSVNYGGGDAGGGNVAVTYSYSTFNDFTVLHQRDDTTYGLNAVGATWWSSRATYLGALNVTG